MALLRCPDCGREVSDAAPSCLHCGRPMEPAAPSNVLAAVARGQTLRCPKCHEALAGTEVWEGGPLTCAWCETEYVIRPPGSPPLVRAHRRGALFQYVAIAALFVCLFTARLLVALPAFATIGFAIGSIARKEPRPILSVLVIVAAVLLLIVA